MDTVDVYALSRDRRSLEGRIALAAMPRLAANLVRADGGVDYRCTGTADAHGRPALLLHLVARLPLRCDRCAGVIELDLQIEREFHFVRSAEELDATPIDASPEEALLGSERFDLGGLIEDELILHLPLSPRHDDCRPAGAPPAEDEELTADRRRPFEPLAGLLGRLKKRS